jgi:transcription elongation factor GreA-like protein
MTAPLLRLAESARRREGEAYEERYKHGKAARIWDRIVTENPEQAEVSRALAEWMNDYEVADAKAEAAFRRIASETECQCAAHEAGR